MSKAEKDAAVTAEKKAKPVRKAAVKAPAQKVEEVYLQFAGEQWCTSALTEQAKATYVAEGHRASAIKKLELYVKPEERRAYYVINEKATGSIEF